MRNLQPLAAPDALNPVLVFKLLEPFRLINIQIAELLAPSIEALLRRFCFLAGSCQALALTLQNLNLPQLRDDLLGT